MANELVTLSNQKDQLQETAKQYDSLNSQFQVSSFINNIML